MSYESIYEPEAWEIAWGLEGRKEYTREGLLSRAIEHSIERMEEGEIHPIDAVAKTIIEIRKHHNNETVKEAIREAVVTISIHDSEENPVLVFWLRERCQQKADHRIVLQVQMALAR